MKILYVTTISNTVNAFLIPHIRMLIEQGHRVDVAFKIEREVRPEIYEMGCKVYDLAFQRSPFNKDNYRAYKKLKQIISNEKYDLVHTHTPVASACVRYACRKIKSTKVFYTAHGFHFYKGAPLKNWLIYYPIEKWLARYTEVLLLINNEDYLRAKKSFKSLKTDKIVYIPGVGLDTRKFSDVIVDKEEKRKELDIPDKSFVLLSVGELNKNKNHETVLRAITKLDNPNLYYVICGQGILEEYLRNLSTKLGIENKVKLLGTRNDIVEICKASDIFVFPSFREGLSVALMEAMASGLPVICSDIRGNSDLIESDKGGYLVKPDDVYGFSKYISVLYSNYINNINNSFGEFNKKRVMEYDIVNVKSRLIKIYK
ncbi:glycosyltransferase family 4 protein [Dehalobacterium formicoaceticum]|uniref:glycosyltransferase family 4 protein n=1 Tax=Dehalobacterium formicoaceticum TaxID=51515 RepID=UPI000B7F87E2|nr:glycosyltransferase family 4 protein [Dehalobacterium formicoaceticum]